MDMNIEVTQEEEGKKVLHAGYQKAECHSVNIITSYKTVNYIHRARQKCYEIEIVCGYTKNLYIVVDGVMKESLTSGDHPKYNINFKSNEANPRAGRISQLQRNCEGDKEKLKITILAWDESIHL